jgi:hypothetical protein
MHTFARLPNALLAQHWPQFRGPGGAGVADGQHPPVSWDVESGRGVVWKTEVPGLGHSSPVVWGDRLFVTSAVSSDPNSVFERELRGEVDYRTDVVTFGSEGIYTYTVDGDLLWKKELGVIHAGKHNNPEYTWGTASSPVLHRGLVNAAPFIQGYDPATGRELWRLGPSTTNTTPTPIVGEGSSS